jgi:hypothetical protein
MCNNTLQGFKNKYMHTRVYVSVCVYVYGYVYGYIYIYIYVYIYIYIHTHAAFSSSAQAWSGVRTACVPAHMGPKKRPAAAACLPPPPVPIPPSTLTLALLHKMFFHIYVEATDVEDKNIVLALLHWIGDINIWRHRAATAHRPPRLAPPPLPTSTLLLLQQMLSPMYAQSTDVEDRTVLMQLLQWFGEVDRWRRL